MIYEVKKDNENKHLKGKVAAIAAILLAVLIAVISINIYMQVIELNEIGGYSFVYFTNLKYKLFFGVIVFVLIFLIISAVTVFIRKNLTRYIKDNSLPQRKFPLLSIALVIALIGAFMTKGMFFHKALDFMYSTGFDTEAPIIGHDIGYYVFQRPFLMALYEFVSGLWLFVILYTAGYYLLILLSLLENISIQDLKIKSIIRHNLINIAIFFIIKTFSYSFSQENILYSKVINVTGAGFVDEKIWLNYYKIAPFLLAVIALTAVFFIFKGSLKKALYTIALYPATWILVSIAALLVQRFVVSPNELNYQSKYLQNNITMTRAAYKLDKIKNIDFPSVKELTPEILARNPETVNNIRVIDYKPTLDNNKQLQNSRSFYTFHDSDIVNYNINGKETPVFISARELDQENLQENTYITRTLKYTHGYGIVINPLNRINAQGQVEFVLSGLSMNSEDKNLKVTEPRIYYGELTDERVIVNAKDMNETDMDGNTETRYDGKGGIKLSLLNRALFAAKYADPNFLISSYVTSDSKLLLNRSIIERAQKAAPFLTLDKDPYILLSDDGKLIWVIDAYTTTNYYPYAQSIGNINYIRNSVKIIVDAYDGSVTYYIVDNEDPIINTYKKIYPGLFSSQPFPADLAKHVIYPESLFKIQTEMLKKYHFDPVANPDSVYDFYSNEDVWSIAQYPQNNDDILDTKEKVDIEPYYSLIKLPDISRKEELILMRPFTPAGKDNMSSWLGVRNSFENYGEMILYSFPKNTNFYGPYQVESNINSIDQVSKDMTLWGQSGSRVFKGSLLVIPIEKSILYVEPIYIQSSGSKIPQVREIVAGYQKGDEFKYGIGTNLNEALSNLFKGAIQTTPDQTNVTPAPPQTTDKLQTDTNKDKLLNNIQKKYDDLKKQIDELGSLINELSK